MNVATSAAWRAHARAQRVAVRRALLSVGAIDISDRSTVVSSERMPWDETTRSHPAHTLAAWERDHESSQNGSDRPRDRGGVADSRGCMERGGPLPPERSYRLRREGSSRRRSRPLPPGPDHRSHAQPHQYPRCLRGVARLVAGRVKGGLRPLLVRTGPARGVPRDRPPGADGSRDRRPNRSEVVRERELRA